MSSTRSLSGWRLLPLALWLLIAIAASHAEAPLISKTFSYGAASVAEVKEALPQVLSSRGKFILVETTRKVVVQDEASNVEAAGAILAEIGKGTPPAPNIRIDLTLREVGGTTDRGITTRGGRIHVDPVENNAFEVSGRDRSGGSDRMVNQFLLVKSGGTASLQVGEEIPMIDFFYNYAIEGGYITNAAVRWQNIGSRMAVTARRVGDVIEVTITPEITTLVNAQQQIVSFTKLATTVTVANGGSIQIGGFDQASDEFNRNFFSRGRRSSSRIGSFTLKASVE